MADLYLFILSVNQIKKNMSIFPSIIYNVAKLQSVKVKKMIRVELHQLLYSLSGDLDCWEKEVFRPGTGPKEKC